MYERKICQYQFYWGHHYTLCTLQDWLDGTLSNIQNYWIDEIRLMNVHEVDIQKVTPLFVHHGSQCRRLERLWPSVCGAPSWYCKTIHSLPIWKSVGELWMRKDWVKAGVCHDIFPTQISAIIIASKNRQYLKDNCLYFRISVDAMKSSKAWLISI